MIELPPDPHEAQTYTLRMPFHDGTADEIETDAGQALDFAAGKGGIPATVRDETYSVDDDGNIIRRWSAVAPREAA